MSSRIPYTDPKNKKFRMSKGLIQCDLEGTINFIVFFSRHYCSKITLSEEDLVLYHGVEEVDFTHADDQIKFCQINKVPILDYIFITHLNDEQKSKIKYQRDNELGKIEYSLQNLTKAIYVFIGLAFIRGSFTELTSTNTTMPKILTNQIGELSRSSIMNMLTKMNLFKGNISSLFKLKNYCFLPSELISRLNKGMAGYRFINAIHSTTLDPNFTVNDKAKNAYNAVIEFRNKGIFLDVHPAFTENDFKKAIPSLSKCLSNLMVELYSKDKLNEMVNQKIINDTPKLDNSIDYSTFLTTENFNKAIHPFDVSIIADDTLDSTPYPSSNKSALGELIKKEGK